MKAALLKCVCLCLLIFSKSIFAAEYYISASGNDSNAGTLQSPWKTLSKANNTLRAGDTVYLTQGVYAGAIHPSSSGSNGAPIAYRAYQNDQVTITNPPATGGRKTAVVLNNVNYIVVSGFYVSGNRLSEGTGAADIDRFIDFVNAKYNLIENCNFQYANGWAGVHFDTRSSFNKILGNSFDAVGTNRIPNGFPDAGNDTGDTMIVKSSYNVIENNRFSRGGHNNLDVHSSFNIIRGNNFDGAWPDPANPGSRAGGDLSGNMKSGVNGPRGFNVFEFNIVRNAALSEDSVKNSGMKIQGVNQIVRGNFYYDNDFDAIKGETRSGTVEDNRNNRIYNNTFYNNNTLIAYRDYGNALPFYDNVWKNNLVANHRAADQIFINIGTYDAPNLDGPRGVSETTLTGNLFEPTVNGSVNFRIAVNGTLSSQNLSWYENRYPASISKNKIGSIAFVNASSRTPDGFAVSSDSPAIDGGVDLTTTGNSGSGTVIQVLDVRYFHDGFGIPGERGDRIVIGNNTPVEVVGIDYANGTLIIDQSISWSAGDSVNLQYKDGAMDIGAHELFEVHQTGFETGPRPKPPSVLVASD